MSAPSRNNPAEYRLHRGEHFLGEFTLGCHRCDAQKAALVKPDPDPRYVEEPLHFAGAVGPKLWTTNLEPLLPARRSKAWLLLALGVGAALGFVAGWVAR